MGDFGNAPSSALGVVCLDTRVDILDVAERVHEALVRQGFRVSTVKLLDVGIESVVHERADSFVASVRAQYEEESAFGSAAVRAQCDLVGAAEVDTGLSYCTDFHGVAGMDVESVFVYESAARIDDRHHIPKFCRVYSQLATELHRVMEPALTVVGSPVDELSPAETARLRGCELIAVDWHTLVGPAVVEKHGEAFFEGMPAHSTERLDDGGYHIVLCPEYIVGTKKEEKRIRSEVRKYCRSFGVKARIGGPIHLPPEALVPLSRYADGEVLGDIDRMVNPHPDSVQDGELVIRLAFDWEDLTSTQTHLVRDTLSRGLRRILSGEEVRGRLLGPVHRIMLEFTDVVPDEIDAFLRAEFGDEPRIGWTAIPLEEIERRLREEGSL